MSVLPPELPTMRLPEDPRPTAAPRWLPAAAIVALYAGYRMLTADPSREWSYGIGAGLGACVLPLLVAWFVTRFWRRSYAPAVVAGLVVALGFANCLLTRAKVERVKAEYGADLERRLQSWSQLTQQWASGPGWDPAELGTRRELDESLRRAAAVRTATVDLMGEVANGGSFRSRLLAAEVRQTAVDAAWGELRLEPAHGEMLTLLRASDRLLHASQAYLTQLDSLFGRWRVDDDGLLRFDADVEEGFVERVERAAADVEARSAELRALRRGDETAPVRLR